MSMLSGHEFVEISRSRLDNDGIAEVKKRIETLVNAGESSFFLDDVYRLVLERDYIRLIEKGKNSSHVQETLTFLDGQRN
jgi:hypothetical protein